MSCASSSRWKEKRGIREGLVEHLGSAVCRASTGVYQASATGGEGDLEPCAIVRVTIVRHFEDCCRGSSTAQCDTRRIDVRRVSSGNRCHAEADRAGESIETCDVKGSRAGSPEPLLEQ